MGTRTHGHPAKGNWYRQPPHAARTQLAEPNRVDIPRFPRYYRSTPEPHHRDRPGNQQPAPADGHHLYPSNPHVAQPGPALVQYRRDVARRAVLSESPRWKPHQIPHPHGILGFDARRPLPQPLPGTGARAGAKGLQQQQPFAKKRGRRHLALCGYRLSGRPVARQPAQPYPDRAPLFRLFAPGGLRRGFVGHSHRKPTDYKRPQRPPGHCRSKRIDQLPQSDRPRVLPVQ